ncbi:Tm-1-like ATP-binding domain-containing protein [Desulfatiglans anilini]|uniref:Tm-1-like ATP-binding domain-containing protein n=1 Tax=Desulfatiglans anilini TaxID=90728 RepID=UPI00040BF88A|nr:Tm-1-like ATP-binding domain-containing protein [Desulfatiglans anilini]
MGKKVLVISTLDTKGQETLYLKERLEARGLEPLLMDISMRGDEASPADIGPGRVAEAGGSSLQEVRESRERSKITNTMIRGGARIAQDLQKEGQLSGVVGLGGSTGSLMATDVMRALPFGVPKLMISSTAALPGLSTRYIGTGDIALFHSVIEISGLSDLLKNVLDRAAAAMAGQVQDDIISPRSTAGKAIALTMLGPCEKCASSVREALTQEGYQVIGFSAAGVCDRAMEDMIADGLFSGVVDLAPGGVGEHLFGFMRDAGPRRLESAGEAGLPQIISTCSVNHMTPAKSKYKPDYAQRPKYDLDRFRTWIRLSADELREVAGSFREKLNRSKGPVKVLIPLKGWSSVDYPGNATHNPEEDLVFAGELRKGLKPDIEILEVDANMEDPAFAAAVVKASLQIF